MVNNVVVNLVAHAAQRCASDVCGCVKTNAELRVQACDFSAGGLAKICSMV